MIELVEKAQKGDAEAFVLLINGLKQGLYRIALSYLRRDADVANALQEMILVCWKKLPTFDKETYTFIQHAPTEVHEETKQFCFNRFVDLTQIASIVVDGGKYAVYHPIFRK